MMLLGIIPPCLLDTSCEIARNNKAARKRRGLHPRLHAPARACTRLHPRAHPLASSSLSPPFLPPPTSLRNTPGGRFTRQHGAISNGFSSSATRTGATGWSATVPPPTPLRACRRSLGRAGCRCRACVIRARSPTPSPPRILQENPAAPSPGLCCGAPGLLARTGGGGAARAAECTWRLCWLAGSWATAPSYVSSRAGPSTWYAPAAASTPLVGRVAPPARLWPPVACPLPPERGSIRSSLPLVAFVRLEVPRLADGRRRRCLLSGCSCWSSP